MKNVPFKRFYALLATLLVLGFAPSSSLYADQHKADESDTRACGGQVCDACVDKLTVCGDAKVRGDLTVCGKICPEVPGPRGKQGKRGKRGKQGPAGPGGALEYAYIYNLSEDQLVPVESDIIFDSNGIISSGIQHIPGQSQIRIVNSGVYFIHFSVTAENSNQFALAVNGFPLPETIYGVRDYNPEVAVTIIPNTASFVLNLLAGDILTLRNHSSAFPVFLATPVGGLQDTVNAAVTIMRIQ